MTHYLQNKIITGIEIASDKKAIRFLILEGTPIVAKADGECCSESWIEHVTLPAMGFPATVISVNDIKLPGTVEDDDGCMQVYGLKVTTDKGEIIIDYRNSSNGYYGGNLSFPDDEYFYGGVFGQNVSNEDLKPLSEDM